MARATQDHYFRLAKREGFVSRAAYKLIEIDDRKQVLRKGDRVLDCGCAPGSWLQVAARRVGAMGIVVGVDLKRPDPATLGANVTVRQGDVTTIPAADLLAEAGSGATRFDVILSDMAPDTTGDPFGDHHRSVRLCEALLERAEELLRTGGHLVMKVFEGEVYPDLLASVRPRFESVKGFKPAASRAVSREMYIVAKALR